MQLKRKLFAAASGVIVLIVSAIFLLYKPYSTKIDKKIATVIARDMFLDYTSRTEIDANQFAKPTIQDGYDGWEVSYSFKSDNSRRLGIFIDRFGKADYSEAP